MTPERTRRAEPRASRRAMAGAAAALLLGLAGAARGQGAPGREAPLRPDPEDFWAEVHRWTGSDATRPRGAAAQAAPAPGRAAPQAAGVLRSVRSSRRSRANIRQAPNLEAPVLRVLAPGTPLNVFAEADGGWLQVGEQQPFGWMHETVLDR